MQSIPNDSNFSPLAGYKICTILEIIQNIFSIQLLWKIELSLSIKLIFFIKETSGAELCQAQETTLFQLLDNHKTKSKIQHTNEFTLKDRYDNNKKDIISRVGQRVYISTSPSP